MPQLHRTGILLGSCAAFILGCPGAAAQTAFYGAPPPSDAGVDFDGDETGLSQVPGVFAKKPFKMTFAVREGFDSNVFQTRDDPVSSFYTNWAAGLNYGIGDPRLQVQSSLGAGLTYYYTRPGEKVDFSGLFDVRVNYLATPRLTLALETSTAYLSQPDQTIVGGNSQQNGDYVYSTTTVLVGYQWTGTISTVTSYNFSTIFYTRSEINDQLGYISQTFAQSVRWLWKPRTTLVTEYRFNPINYFSADLDSLANYFLVGFDQVFNPRLTWSATCRSPDKFQQRSCGWQFDLLWPLWTEQFELSIRSDVRTIVEPALWHGAIRTGRGEPTANLSNRPCPHSCDHCPNLGQFDRRLSGELLRSSGRYRNVLRERSERRGRTQV